MNTGIGELEKQIQEKNLILESLGKCRVKDEEMLERVRKELDTLLYTYYKALRCNQDYPAISWCAAH